MTPEKDLTDAANLVDEMARYNADKDHSDAVLLYALARRLRQHAKQTELKDCRTTAQGLIQRIQDLHQYIIAAGLPIPRPHPPQPGRQPTPPPVGAGRL